MPGEEGQVKGESDMKRCPEWDTQEGTTAGGEGQSLAVRQGTGLRDKGTLPGKQRRNEEGAKRNLTLKTGKGQRTRRLKRVMECQRRVGQRGDPGPECWAQPERPRESALD